MTEVAELVISPLLSRNIILMDLLVVGTHLAMHMPQCLLHRQGSKQLQLPFWLSSKTIQHCTNSPFQSIAVTTLLVLYRGDQIQLTLNFAPRGVRNLHRAPRAGDAVLASSAARIRALTIDVMSQALRSSLESTMTCRRC